jgi:hypothetical protein
MEYQEIIKIIINLAPAALTFLASYKLMQYKVTDLQVKVEELQSDKEVTTILLTEINTNMKWMREAIAKLDLKVEKLSR